MSSSHLSISSTVLHNIFFLFSLLFLLHLFYGISVYPFPRYLPLTHTHTHSLSLSLRYISNSVQSNTKRIHSQEQPPNHHPRFISNGGTAAEDGNQKCEHFFFFLPFHFFFLLERDKPRTPGLRCEYHTGELCSCICIYESARVSAGSPAGCGGCMGAAGGCVSVAPRNAGPKPLF